MVQALELPQLLQDVFQDDSSRNCFNSWPQDKVSKHSLCFWHNIQHRTRWQISLVHLKVFHTSLMISCQPTADIRKHQQSELQIISYVPQRHRVSQSFITRHPLLRRTHHRLMKPGCGSLISCSPVGIFSPDPEPLAEELFVLLSDVGLVHGFPDLSTTRCCNKHPPSTSILLLVDGDVWSPSRCVQTNTSYKQTWLI